MLVQMTGEVRQVIMCMQLANNWVLEFVLHSPAVMQGEREIYKAQNYVIQIWGKSESEVKHIEKYFGQTCEIEAYLNGILSVKDGKTFVINKLNLKGLKSI